MLAEIIRRRTTHPSSSRRPRALDPASRRRSRRVLILGWLLCLPTFGVWADMWVPPKPWVTVAPSGDVAVRIVPASHDGPCETPADATLPKARAEIYRDRYGTGQRWLHATFDLVNRTAPVSALLSADGRYLVTFDNWGSVGHGPGVVVIYQTDGTVIRSFQLDEILTQRDIDLLPASASSIFWAGRHAIDAESDELILQIATCTRAEGDGCEDRTHPLRVDLATGDVLAEKQDLLPVWKSDVRVDAADDSGLEPWRRSTRPHCAEGWTAESFSSARRVPFAELQPLARPLPVPTMPNLVVRADLHGEARFELLVGPDGEVVCVRPLKSMPMGVTEASIESLLDWRVEPTDEADTLRTTVLGITIEPRRLVWPQPQ